MNPDGFSYLHCWEPNAVNGGEALGGRTNAEDDFDAMEVDEDEDFLAYKTVAEMLVKRHLSQLPPPKYHF